MNMVEQISTLSISKLQKAFDLAAPRKQYLFVDTGCEPLYTDEPFRTETYSVVWLRQGVMHLQADLTSTVITGPAVITLGPSVTRSFRRSDERPDMQLFFFTADFLLETLANIFYLDRYRFFEDNEGHVLQLHEQEAFRLASIFNLVSGVFGRMHPNEPQLMRSYGYLLIHEIDAIHRSRSAGQQPDEGNLLFTRFRNLLTKEFWRHRTVGFYASNLNVTPKYLSEVIKKQSGKTAGEWINKAVMLEARVLLQNRTLSIARVSERLSFSDQSVFGKFFKTHQGLSPAEYRKSLSQ
ncbi:AraC family transcriptional regulator [Mucilaginibacter conchicola]|uniref:AraC family transcriptional regulator n=1 Tax=Mucilaginibacter conchicola TaxID=2303333 RepID=A0A372NQF5_9SPHI|nr:AraC family transcriptional regulator [Mucilaginibacter conchicola]RFZ91164.1 AraC family transcriptional regulator [Mucilaginibacter conchicola]